MMQRMHRFSSIRRATLVTSNVNVINKKIYHTNSMSTDRRRMCISTIRHTAHPTTTTIIIKIIYIILTSDDDKVRQRIRIWRISTTKRKATNVDRQ